MEVIQDAASFPNEKQDADWWNLRQPDFLPTELPNECSSSSITDAREDSNTTSTTRKEQVERSTTADLCQISSNSMTSNIFTRSRSPSLANYYSRGKDLDGRTESLESGEEDDDDDESSSQGETESFDPFDIAEDEDEDDSNDNALVNNNVLWTYISNSDGSASAHPTFAPPVEDDDHLFATAVKSPGSAAAAPKHSRRVSFDDMMQVRYFCRSQEERVDMKKFSVLMKSQIRRRRRRSRLNLSDSSDECADQAMGWNMATKASSQRDDDSLSGIFADVVDDISDLITEAVIDAQRQHQRAFFREPEEDDDPPGLVRPISQGFLGSFGCMPTIQDYQTATTPRPVSADESSAITPPSTTTAPNNTFLETWHITASSRAIDEAALPDVDEEEDEPWFCKAMRCGSKCGNV